MNPLIAYRLLRFYLKSGLPRWTAIKKAVTKAMQP
jgi:hypothetical protein